MLMTNLLHQIVVTSLAASETWASVIPSSTRQYPSVLLLPTVVGLSAIAWQQHNRTLTMWAETLMAGLVLGAAFQDSSLGWFDSAIPYQTLLPQLAFLGAVLAGLVRFRTEAGAVES